MRSEDGECGEGFIRRTMECRIRFVLLRSSQTCASLRRPPVGGTVSVRFNYLIIHLSIRTYTQCILQCTTILEQLEFKVLAQGSESGKLVFVLVLPVQYLNH